MLIGELVPSRCGCVLGRGPENSPSSGVLRTAEAPDYINVFVSTPIDPCGGSADVIGGTGKGASLEISTS